MLQKRDADSQLAFLSFAMALLNTIGSEIMLGWIIMHTKKHNRKHYTNENCLIEL